MNLKFPLIIALASLLNVCVQAQDGTLDSSFGSGGIVRMDISSYFNEVAKSVITQPDGKIIVAGYHADHIKDNFCLVRFNHNGSVDSSFGPDGVVITNFTNTSIASDIALQTDGRIIVAGHSWGTTDNEFALARYNPDGSPDSTFGTLGLVMTPFSGKSAAARTLKIQNDGKIIVGGHVYTVGIDWDEFALARYNPDGSLDNTFGTSGQLTTSFGAGTRNWINSIQLQPDGKIVAGGFSNNQFAIARYHSNGTLDNTFGTSGLVTTLIPGTTQGVINAVALSPSGSIFAGGFSVDTMSNFTIVKYNSSGIPDNTFGSSGILVSKISPEQDAIADILIQADNKLLVGGSTNESSIFQFVLARFDSLGNPDPTFGTAGIVKTLIHPTFNQLEAITLQPDGKILATGFVGNYPYDIAVTRYMSTMVSSKSPGTLPDQITIYPNPTSDILHITFTPEHQEDISIKLFDCNGQVLLAKSFTSFIPGEENTESLQLTTYTAGIYFVNISTLTTNQTFKIIKK